MTDTSNVPTSTTTGDVLTRGEAIGHLYESAGRPEFEPVWEAPFDDVPVWHEYFIPVAWAFRVFGGVPKQGELFRPDDYLTYRVAIAWAFGCAGRSPDEFQLANLAIDFAIDDAHEWVDRAAWPAIVSRAREMGDK
ncbi:hypothetical protein [Puerhibacterium puerhi]|uniref:hypothetical protein n=1 Tax=Puerhibacterium puerhi TaxID=2692623 RepID=UPI00135A7005|nr:hypothetical protein [Puerhibacterium puerhi]